MYLLRLHLRLLLVCTWTTAFQSTFSDQILIDTSQIVCEVSEKFLSVAIDTKFIFHHDLRVLMKSAVFMNLLRSLHPAYLRIGGTAADLVLFDDTFPNIKNLVDYHRLSQMDSLSWTEDDDTGCHNHTWPVVHMSRDKWLSLNTLAEKSDLNLLFDLNVLIRMPSGKWNPQNAKKLIEFSQENNLTLDWQLGNEPNSFCHVFGKEVSPFQLSRDFHTLSRILKKIPLYRDSKLVGPDITAPRGPKKRQLATLTYLDKFLSKAKGVVSAASWHQYYVNGRNATVEEFKDPKILDVLKREIQDVKAVVMKNTNEHFPIWITETASAFGGGAPYLSDRFVSGFMWLDKLGMAAANNISVVVRQSFIGGHYGLIGEKSGQPTPDFWVSYIFKKIVGNVVLQLKKTNPNPLIRLYAHCHRNSEIRNTTNSLVIFGMNLGVLDYKAHMTLGKKHSSKMYKVEKYILTSVNGHIDSRGIRLNGKELKITSAQQIPPLNPIFSTTKLLEVPLQSMVFYVVKGLELPVCK